jgi:hypothetical protein
MKKVILFIFLLAYGIPLKAQYLEFPDSGAVWNIHNKYFGTGTPDMHSCYYNIGDTIINNSRYLKLGGRGDYYDPLCGYTKVLSLPDRYIRTDTVNGKVYEWDGTNDRFHLDYNMQAGDFMKVGYDTNTCNIIDSFFTAYLYGKNRRVWRYGQDGIQDRHLIEGIGCSDGLFMSSVYSGFSCFEWSSNLNFCLNNNSLSYYELPDYHFSNGCFGIPDLFTAPPCTVSFSILPNPLFPGVYVGTHSLPNTYLSFYNWDFGDGTTSSLQYPVHEYDTPGVYKVCLTYGVNVPPQCNPYASCTYCDSSFYVFKKEGGLMSKLIFSNPVGLKEIEDNSFNIYPNPANDKFTLSLDDAILDGEIYFSDIRGRVLNSATISSLEQEFSLASFSNGVYFVTIRKNGASYVKRLVVSK